MEHKFRISSLKTIYLQTGNMSAGLAVSRRHANVEGTYWTILALCFFSQRLTWAEHLESVPKSKCFLVDLERIVIYFQKQILTFEKDKYTHTHTYMFWCFVKFHACDTYLYCWKYEWLLKLHSCCKPNLKKTQFATCGRCFRDV